MESFQGAGAGIKCANATLEYLNTQNPEAGIIMQCQRDQGGYTTLTQLLKAALELGMVVQNWNIPSLGNLRQENCLEFKALNEKLH